MNAELRLPVPLPVAVALVGATLAAALFLFVVRTGVKPGGETTFQTARTTATRPGEEPVNERATGPAAQLARALERHRVVVVALLLPDVTVDREAAAEAGAGARVAGVGFVALNARNRGAAALAIKLGFTTTPAVAVVGRDLTPRFRVDGFADRESVVQAAVGAGG